MTKYVTAGSEVIGVIHFQAGRGGPHSGHGGHHNPGQSGYWFCRINRPGQRHIADTPEKAVPVWARKLGAQIVEANSEKEAKFKASQLPLFGSDESLAESPAERRQRTAREKEQDDH